MALFTINYWSNLNRFVIYMELFASKSTSAPEYAGIYIHTHTYIYTHTYTYIHGYINIHAYVHIDPHTHPYSFIHKHTYQLVPEL